MILTALADYYERRIQEPDNDLPLSGFSRQKMRVVSFLKSFTYRVNDPKCVLTTACFSRRGADMNFSRSCSLI